MISHNEEFFGPICPERWVIPGDGTVTVTGAEWMEAVKAKELEAKKNASKLLAMDKVEKFDGFGNLIVEGAGKAKVYDSKDLKALEKKMKDFKKKGASADEMLDLELEIDEANRQVSKQKADDKAEKDKQKALTATGKPTPAPKATKKK